MLKDVVAIEVLEPYRLRPTFEDGVVGEVDLARLVGFEGVFAPLRDPASFRAVRIEPEAGTIVRPNGADLDPDVLYAGVTGVPVEARLGVPQASWAGTATSTPSPSMESTLRCYGDRSRRHHTLTAVATVSPDLCPSAQSC